MTTEINECTQSATWLLEYGKNIVSQYGEDGILEKIFAILGQGDKWCVEFGAVDGKHLSNTWNLLNNHNWAGVLIEANKRKYNKLVKNYSGNPKVNSINRFVEFEGDNSLDKILSSTLIPKDFDLLSIDIDGNDYHVWESVKVYKPKVVILEFNPTIPNSVDFIQERKSNINQGSSLSALIKLGNKKGYQPICVTESNVIFVINEQYYRFRLTDNAVDNLRPVNPYEMKIFQLYDGTLVLQGCKKMLWHGIDIKDNKIQVIPRFFRIFPSGSTFRGMLWIVLSKLTKKK